MYISVVPPIIVMLVRFLLSGLIVCSVIFFAIGFGYYFFSKKAKDFGAKRIKTGIQLAVIVLTLLIITILIEQLTPRTWLGISKPTIQYGAQ